MKRGILSRAKTPKIRLFGSSGFSAFCPGMRQQTAENFCFVCWIFCWGAVSGGYQPWSAMSL